VDLLSDISRGFPLRVAGQECPLAKTVPASPNSATSIRAVFGRVVYPCPVSTSFAPAQAAWACVSSRFLRARLFTSLDLKAAIRHRADLRVANKSALSKTVPARPTQVTSVAGQ
jgi:hypothetical protein